MPMRQRTSEQGNEIIYFGQERVDTQAGDANMGFWFLQDPTVGPNASGGFDGKHVDGDILIQSSLTNGGGVSDIHVFKWTASGLTEVTGLTGAGASAASSARQRLRVCQHGHDHASLGRRSRSRRIFYEGGLNLSALFPGQALPCFSTFVSNTRTSQSDRRGPEGLRQRRDRHVRLDRDQEGHAAERLHAEVRLHVRRAGNATFQLADGESKTMNKLSPGTYHVSEGATAAGWSFDSVSCGVGDSYVQKSGANLTIALPLIGKVECTYVNKRDTGSLTLSKVLTGGPAGYTGPFTINYDCNDGTAHDGSKSVSAGSTSSAITGIPTGTQCTISETPPTAPTGYTFGTPTFSPSATVTIANKDQTVNVQTTNTLTRDTGSLTLSKVLTGGPAGYTGPFTINYDCNDGTAHDGSKSVSAGSTSSAITGIPTGTQCTVSETPPTAPRVTRSARRRSRRRATATITNKDQTVNVQTTNTLTRDTGSLKLSKSLHGRPGGLYGAVHDPLRV